MVDDTIQLSMAMQHSLKILRRFSSNLFFAGSLLFAFLILIPAPATAQTNRDQAHILPRGASTMRSSAPQPIRADVDLVLVNVTVLDHRQRAVTGLQAEDFTVLDDNNLQTIKYVSNLDEAISLVVVFDASGSMASRIQAARNAVKELINSSNLQDEFGLVVIKDEPRVVSDLTDSINEMQRSIDIIEPGGVTALWDGMYLGVQELRNSRYRRKAMVVISDGGDNHSRYTESELKSLLEEAAIEVYAIGLFDQNARRVEEKMGPRQLDELASITGGRMFSVYDSAEFSPVVTQISRELRNQYVLGYYPTNRNRDGKWRKLKVRFSGSAAGKGLHLYAKKGYYAPEE